MTIGGYLLKTVSRIQGAVTSEGTVLMKDFMFGVGAAELMICMLYKILGPAFRLIIHCKHSISCNPSLKYSSTLTGLGSSIFLPKSYGVTVH